MHAIGHVPEHDLNAGDLAGFITNGRFDRVGVSQLAADHGALLNRLKDLPGLDDVAIVTPIFLGQVGRMNVEVVFADELGEGQLQPGAKEAIAKCKAAGQVLAAQVLRNNFD